MRQIKACGVFIIKGNPVDEFLLMIHPDRLDVPKGHVDPGESEMECALRELQEETGISEQDISLLPDFRFTLEYNVNPKRFGYEECHKTLVVFLGRLNQPDQPIVVTEHEGFRWEKWDPPHKIQELTIDPLLKYTEQFFAEK